ncbi:hypothetical protein Rmet_6511 [Cupriavidus metallidurans CH34]|uniref:Uncharacterized protein n=1 Tax=Cupriavidus metallidurans (strain ATCC 43123 / DSM 2839 / NBRC 102507 / CH34) TaxID=266264 RepID=D3DXU9_CUPMC|nr:hypothetical protein Rmet_6511 [Cupriavidus metallidurans CH34]
MQYSHGPGPDYHNYGETAPRAMRLGWGTPEPCPARHAVPRRLGSRTCGKQNMTACRGPESEGAPLPCGA